MKSLEFKVELNRDEKAESKRLVDYAKYIINNQMLQMLEMKTSEDVATYDDTFTFRMKAGDIFYAENSFKDFFKILKEQLKCDDFSYVTSLTFKKMDVTKDSRTWVTNYTCVFTQEQKQRRASIHAKVLNILVQYVLSRVNDMNVRLINNGILYQQDPFDLLLPQIAPLYSRPLSAVTFELSKEIQSGFRDYFKNSHLIYNLNIVKNTTDFSKYAISFKMDVLAYFAYQCILEECEKLRHDENAISSFTYSKPLRLMAKNIFDFTFLSKVPIDKTHENCLRSLLTNVDAISAVGISQEGMLIFTIDGSKVPKKRFASS